MRLRPSQIVRRLFDSLEQRSRFRRILYLVMERQRER
jgi:hypothetical protein